MQSTWVGFPAIWFVDFEFSAPPGDRPTPICLVAREMGTNRTLRVWEDELKQLRGPPYCTGQDALIVAYYASAEMGCHLSLNWELPAHVLDLYVEFRNLTNGIATPAGSGLLGALVYFGIDSIEAAEKEEMRQLALRGGPWSWDERMALLEYCESDVDALIKLFERMRPHLDLHRALLRGRHMKAAARIEHVGIPIDTQSHRILLNSWPVIQEALINRVDQNYGVFAGHTFKVELFSKWLDAQRIWWPRLPSGALKLDDDTFREMAKVHSSLAPLRELRHALSQLRLADLQVGIDERNRCLLSAFRSTTGRNQPSNSKFIFGPSVWLRGLIKPPPGTGLAYIDWAQQEFGIAAALSGDTVMMDAYQSGDPYLAFAKQAGAAPPHATKTTHSSIREVFKACALGVQYGMGSDSLALRIGRSPFEARQLLELHRRTYPRFWKWSDAAVDQAMLRGYLYTVFGWMVHVNGNPNPRMLRNFPMQGNGAEMLRLACCLATDRGIRICAPVHDAILIEAPIGELEDRAAQAQEAMAEASRIVLDEFQLRTEVKFIRYPDRYMDDRGMRMWDTVWEVIEKLSKPAHKRAG